MNEISYCHIGVRAFKGEADRPRWSGLDEDAASQLQSVAAEHGKGFYCLLLRELWDRFNGSAALTYRVMRANHKLSTSSLLHTNLSLFAMSDMNEAVPVLQMEPTLPSQPRSPVGSIEVKTAASEDAEKAEDARSTPDPIADLLNDKDDFPEGGRGWFVVLGAFIYAALAMGWPLCWGVFQGFFTQNNTFPGASPTTLSLLGTIQNGVSRSTVVGVAHLLTQSQAMVFAAFFSGKLGDRL